MLIEDAIAALQISGVPEKIAEMRAYHKVNRAYWGLEKKVLDDQVRSWRQELPLGERLKLASDLWESNAHEGRICAAKLLTQSRIRPDDVSSWALIKSWVPDLDSSIISDHLCLAGQRRLNFDSSRIQEVEAWTLSPHMWTRRAVLVITLPWTKHRNPKPNNLAIREQVLKWIAIYVDDHDTFIQRSVAWWLCELSRKDPERVAAFMAEHGHKMRNFARKDASRFLPHKTAV